MAITVAAGQIILADDINNLVPRQARKTSDETVNNSAAFQNDNDLLLSVVANATYSLEGLLLFNSGATPDIKFQWTYPTGLTMRWGIGGVVTTFAVFNMTEVSVPVLDGTGVATGAYVDGTVIVSSTAGTLQLQWAQNTSNATATQLLQNSYVQASKF